MRVWAELSEGSEDEKTVSEVGVSITGFWTDLSEEEEEYEGSKSYIDAVTRSGRIYAAPIPAEGQEKRSVDPLTLDEKEGEEKKKKDALGPAPNDLLQQLRKTNANVSVWKLLELSFEHRRALIDALIDAQVSSNVTPEALSKSVSSVAHTDSPVISFEEAELPPGGSAHLRALYVDVTCNGKYLTRVLVDGGSSLNVCPLHTLEKIGIPESELRPAPFAVRAYDNSRREVLGLFTLPLTVGPTISEVEFTVLDIPSSYSLLLGRPWYHPLGAVPSTVHQIIKAFRQERWR